MNDSKNEQLQAQKLAAEFLKRKCEQVDSFIKNAKRVDPKIKALSRELDYLKSAGFMNKNDALEKLSKQSDQRESLINRYKSYKKEELLNELVNTKLELILESIECARLGDIVNFLRKEFDNSQLFILENSKKFPEELTSDPDPIRTRYMSVLWN